jgi:hypothetical protein
MMVVVLGGSCPSLLIRVGTLLVGEVTVWCLLSVPSLLRWRVLAGIAWIFLGGIACNF